ncbi:unnamed protein product, partial [Nesidiocoris tenuis]
MALLAYSANPEQMVCGTRTSHNPEDFHCPAPHPMDWITALPNPLKWSITIHRLWVEYIIDDLHQSHSWSLGPLRKDPINSRGPGPSHLRGPLKWYFSSAISQSFYSNRVLWKDHLTKVGTKSPSRPPRHENPKVTGAESLPEQVSLWLSELTSSKSEVQDRFLVMLGCLSTEGTGSKCQAGKGN